MDNQDIKINKEIEEKPKKKRGRPFKIDKVLPVDRQREYMLDPAKREAHRLACAKYNQKLKAMRIHCKNMELTF